MMPMSIQQNRPIGVVPGSKRANPLWLPKPDVDRAHAGGAAALSELVAVPAHRVLFEAHSQRPVGVLSRYVGLSKGVAQVKGQRAHKRLVYPEDLATSTDIAEVFHRSKQTVMGWTKEETFPAPVCELGRSSVYYLPEVRRWFRQYRMKRR